MEKVVSTKEVPAQLGKLLKKQPQFEAQFSPTDELVEISSLPRIEKKAALKVFKERLTAQEEAWAACRVAIEEVIEKNPDTDKADLMDIARQFGDAYGFTDTQYEEAEGYLDDYADVRRKVVKARADFPDDHELAAHLTGLTFSKSTPMIAETGPMSIDLVTDGLTANKIYEGRDALIFFKRVAAFATRSSDGINYSVFKPIGDNKSVRIHELQHQKNQIFREYFDRDVNAEHIAAAWEGYCSVDDEETKRVYAEAFLRPYMKGALDRAKDELMAHAITPSGGASLRGFQNLLKPSSFLNNFFPVRVGFYDYLKHERGWKGDGDNDNIWKEVSEDILGTEYLKHIDKAITAYESLKKFYSDEELIALLTDKPMEDWSKFAARVYSSKLKDVEMSAQEVRDLQKRKNIQQSLTRRSLLVGGAVGAGALAYHSVMKEAKDTHENAENISALETPNAHYKITYSSPLLEADSRTLEGSDGLVIEVSDDEDGSWWVERESLPGRSGFASSKGDEMLATAYGLDMNNLPLRYRGLLNEAVKRGTPVYLLETPEETHRYDDMKGNIQAFSFAAPPGLMLGLGVLAKQDLARPNRRGLLAGVAKIAAAAGLGLPFAEKLAKASEPYEPNVGGASFKISKALNAINSNFPTLGENDNLRIRSLLTAQKAETLGRWLTEKYGKKPVLSLIVDRDVRDIEQLLQETETERMKEITKFLKHDISNAAGIQKVVRREEGDMETNRFRDEAFISDE